MLLLYERILIYVLFLRCVKHIIFNWQGYILMEMKEYYQQSIIEELETLENEHDLRKYKNNCSGQLKLVTVLVFFQHRFSDSFDDNPPLYSCGLSEL